MPRFAANLGFTPLEPLKPGDVSCLRPMPAVAAEPRHRAADVPAAQFDWTGAGLVNPLDGKLLGDTIARAFSFGVFLFQ